LANNGEAPNHLRVKKDAPKHEIDKNNQRPAIEKQGVHIARTENEETIKRNSQENLSHQALHNECANTVNITVKKITKRASKAEDRNFIFKTLRIVRLEMTILGHIYSKQLALVSHIYHQLRNYNGMPSIPRNAYPLPS
jgi:SPX domain protein involved in polyphosphate accumulation